MFSKTNIKQLFLKILTFLMSFIIILSSDTIYSLNNGYIYLEISLAFLFILTFVIDPLWDITYHFLLIFLGYIALGTFLCITSDFSAYSLYNFGFLFPLCMLIANYFLGKHKIRAFLESLLFILTIITVISLIFWILGSNLKLISPTSSTFITWGETPKQVTSYFNLYFEPQGMPVDGLISRLNIMMLSRNSSIFVEAVLANFFFSIGFILSEILNKGKKYRIIYLVAIFSTFTTSGFTVAGLFILYSIIRTKPTNLIGKVLKYLVYIVTLIFVVCFALLLVTDKSSTISGNDRRLKVTNELIGFLNSPIYGNGINTYTKGSSNALSAVAADGGILLFLIHYFPLIKLTISSFIKMNSSLIIFISLFFLMETSVVQYTLFVIIAVALSWELVLMNKNEKFC